MQCEPLQDRYDWRGLEGDPLLYPMRDYWFVFRDHAFMWLAKTPRAMPYDGLSMPWGTRNLVSPLRNPARPGGLLHDAGYKDLLKVWIFDPREQFGWKPQESMSRWWVDTAFNACNQATGLHPLLCRLVFRGVRVGARGPWRREHARFEGRWPSLQAYLCDRLDLAIPLCPDRIPYHILEATA